MIEELIKLGFTLQKPNVNYQTDFWMLYPLKLKKISNGFLDIDTKVLFKLITKSEL